jgi:hypothetical protein
LFAAFFADLTGTAKIAEKGLMQQIGECGEMIGPIVQILPYRRDTLEVEKRRLCPAER